MEPQVYRTIKFNLTEELEWIYYQPNVYGKSKLRYHVTKKGINAYKAALVIKSKPGTMWANGWNCPRINILDFEKTTDYDIAYTELLNTFYVRRGWKDGKETDINHPSLNNLFLVMADIFRGKERRTGIKGRFLDLIKR